MRLQSNIEDSLNHKLFTVGIFLDFTKAYNMLWSDGLIHKLIKLNIGGKMFEWIKNFVTNCTFQVKIGDSVSTSHSPKNGTPQGSVISPILFLIMMLAVSSTEDVCKELFFEKTVDSGEKSIICYRCDWYLRRPKGISSDVNSTQWRLRFLASLQRWRCESDGQPTSEVVEIKINHREMDFYQFVWLSRLKTILYYLLFIHNDQPEGRQTVTSTSDLLHS